MFDELTLFRGRDLVINSRIRVRQPSLDEICTLGEQQYFSFVSAFCATPSEYKVQLYDEFGIYYESISEFDFFITMIKGLPFEDVSILFPDLNFKNFRPVINEQNQEIVLYDPVSDVAIDNSIYTLITSYIRTINGFKKQSEKAGNKHTQAYLIDKERRHQQNRKRRNEKFRSILIPLISSLVNCEQFKYNHQTVWELPIYVFMDSVKRIQKLKDYDQIMQGIYTGNIDKTKLSLESINWMGSLE